MAVLALALVAGAASLQTPSRTVTTTGTAVETEGAFTAATVPTYATAALAVASVRATRTHLSASTYTSRPGAAVRLAGKVTYGSVRVRSQIVRLQVRSGTTWKRLATKRLTSAGRVAFVVRPQAARAYRLAFPAHAGYGASVSSVRTVRVTAYPARSAARIVALAAAQTGKPYAYGAAGPRAFDCSGFTMYIFSKVGIGLPHKAHSQRARGRAVSRAAARPGDLVIFLSGGYGYHVGIYAGGSYMYDSPHPGARVGKHKIWTWSGVVFRRLL
jgi:peptidoglycan DL-endopeptidase CwlO